MGKRIAIVGTRFTRLHSQKWIDQIQEFIDALPPDTEVFTGGAPGTDLTAAECARERGLKVHVLFPDAQYSQDARFFVHQNRSIVGDADEVHAFWDGLSAGTHHAIQLARFLKIPLHVHYIHVDDWDARK